jgi:hypothetical protein
MSYVYFLGAGFSAAYGLPVMNDFFRVARENKLIIDEKEFLAEVQRFAHMGVRLVTISRNNMEEILSFLEMAEQADQIPERLSELSKVDGKPISPAELLKSIIARVYGPLDPPRSTQLTSNFMDIFRLNSNNPTPDFSQAQQANIQAGNSYGISGTNPPIQMGIALPHLRLPELTVITTNYDLCLETQLLQFSPSTGPISLPIPPQQSDPNKAMKLQLVGDWISAEGHAQGAGDTSGIYDNQSPAKLIRLHGAVNWNSPGYELNGRTYQFRVTSNVDPHNNQKNVPWATTQQCYEKPKAPIIITPTVFKHQADGPYAEQWREAAKALASATQLVFIGYSFPESDAYMRYFLGASLAENVAIEAIHIIDPNADAIAQRLKDRGHYGAHFLDLLRPYNRCWHKD